MSAGGDRFCRLGADGLAGDERLWPPLEPRRALSAPGLALLVGFAIPDRVIDSKQPQFLVEIVQRIPAAQPLRPDQQRWDRRQPGTGAEAKRYYYVRRKQGELKYGLDWPDAQGSFVSQTGFADWRGRIHRQQGPVSLVLLMDKGEKYARLTRYRNRITPTSWAGSFSFSTCRNERLDLSWCAPAC